MGTGQSMLTLMAMMMLTMLTNRVNMNILQCQDTSQNSKFALVAVSLATSKIETASRLAFDEASANAAVTAVTSLTASTSLGKESGESTENTFDDFDDYNNLSYRDSTLASAMFDLKCTIGYVNAATPDVITTSKTWNKKMLVTVTSPSMRDTIRISSVFSYWNFR